MAPDEPLPALGLAELEILMAALDPCLDGFGAGNSCLDDAVAYLARLGIPPTAAPAADTTAQPGQGGGTGGLHPLIRWIEGWRSAGGDRRTLRLMVATLLAQQERPDAA
ncbi:MAG: hypothetical protein ACO3B3_07615 [Cyanobium sp.]